jgi:addiction module RelE/StbE family toxin
MRVVRCSDFVKSAGLLPAEIQNKLSFLIFILAENPSSPRLHMRKLTGRFHGLRSFRVTRDWRVIFYFIGSDTAYLVDVGHRKDIYR